MGKGDIEIQFLVGLKTTNLSYPVWLNKLTNKQFRKTWGLFIPSDHSAGLYYLV